MPKTSSYERCCRLVFSLMATHWLPSAQPTCFWMWGSGPPEPDGILARDHRHHPPIRGEHHLANIPAWLRGCPDPYAAQGWSLMDDSYRDRAVLCNRDEAPGTRCKGETMHRPCLQKERTSVQRQLGV